MNILVIGSGGREHALVWKLSSSGRVDKIFALPGNGGISELAETVNIGIDDLERIAGFVEKNQIDLTIVGPEAPLVSGIVNLFDKRGLKIFGPSQEAAQLEGSKVFAKRFMKEFNIPTAEFEIFDDYHKAKEYIKTKNFPLVIKADGLCGGKGVLVAGNLNEAEDALDKMMKEKSFGHAGDSVVIEEFLSGEEASIIAISDGKNLIALASSQDHKQIYDGDKGPNTGGMGAYSPAPVVEGGVFEKTIKKVLYPVIKGMDKKGFSFKGVLYAGIMVVEKEPFVLEFNVRFGDPETQAVLPRMKSDLVEVIIAALENRLDCFKIEWYETSCVTVVLVSGGYPGSYEKGKRIFGLNKINDLEDVVVFHAGTKKVSSGADEFYVTAGGRVLNVTALGKDIKEAKDKAYKAADLISFDNMYYRKDISDKAL